MFKNQKGSVDIIMIIFLFAVLGSLYISWLYIKNEPAVKQEIEIINTKYTKDPRICSGMPCTSVQDCIDCGLVCPENLRVDCRRIHIDYKMTMGCICGPHGDYW